MKKEKIKFYVVVVVVVESKLIKIIGVKAFTLQGEKFIIHRPYESGVPQKENWVVSHLSTGLGTGVIENTQDKVLNAFKARVKKYKLNIKNAVGNKVQVNNKKEQVPCINCQEFKLAKNMLSSYCVGSEKQPHKRKTICKKFVGAVHVNLKQQV